MIEFLGSSFLGSYALLRECQDQMRRLGAEKGAGTELTKDERKWVRILAEQAERDCKAIGLDEAALLANGLHWRVNGPQSCNYERADAELYSVISLMSVGLGKQRFAFVPADRRKYFESDNLFHLSQPSPFPSADRDIRDAGNAYALGLHTACVFHLMRVAEIGLRLFAKHLRVKLPKKKGPVAWAVWEDILNHIRIKIDKIVLKPGTKPKKAETRAFYRGVLTEFEGFKDIYRNDVMHVRKTYLHTEAASALELVGRFMQRLGTRIHE